MKETYPAEMKPEVAPRVSGSTVPVEEIPVVTDEEKTMQSWERTFSGILSSNDNRLAFEDGLSAFIDIVNDYAHKDRPGTNEGDNVFREKMEKFAEVLELCKEGHPLEEIHGAIRSIRFTDPGLREKLYSQIEQHYPSKQYSQ